MGKSTISMAIFNSKLLVYQRVSKPNPCLVSNPSNHPGFRRCCLNSVHWWALLLETTVCCCCFGSKSVVRNLYIIMRTKFMYKDLKTQYYHYIYIYINTIRTVFDMQRQNKMVCYVLTCGKLLMNRTNF